jgi:hypothetical protein
MHAFVRSLFVMVMSPILIKRVLTLLTMFLARSGVPNGQMMLVPSRRSPKYLTRLPLLLLSSHAFTMTGSGVLEVMSIQTLRVK